MRHSDIGEEMDTLLLARLQFATTASTHFLFVSLSLGLVVFVVAMETAYVVTGRALFERMTKFWGRLYVVNYGVGIIGGIVMELQLGLNWSGLTQAFGDAFGGALAMETLVAFFVEATLLGAWIFGWGVLGRKTHLVLIWLVAITAYVSAMWILAANAFLQHPIGDTHLTGFGALLSNPNLWDAFLHVAAASLVVGSVFVAGVSAWHLIRRTEEATFFRRSLRMAVAVLPVGTFAAVHWGMLQILVITANQPMKLAVMEGDPARMANLQRQLTEAYGPGDYVPPQWIETAFQVMTQAGFGLVLLSVVLVVLLRRDWLIRLRVPLYALVAVIPVPFALVVLGRLVREVGRQPWTVYGLLSTREAVTDVPAGAVLVSFVATTLVMLALVVTGYWLIARLARRGPEDDAFGSRLETLEPVGTTAL
ncbi:cytochrome ubiquinol oxidase subunit I [Streptosporangium saharense]|uniref:cytochrome ubiquinol oxidase subunit I n=1 Tax=Streptosporangium saharense TaxID=1706840 RepID=UPI0036912021